MRRAVVFVNGEEAERRGAAPAAVIILFSVTIFTSALLLFLVQPMFAKLALPLLGGSPAVWTTCMMFFQTTLLVGYAYAHAATTRLDIRRQTLLHTAVLLGPLLVLPIAIAPAVRPSADLSPVAWLLRLLLVALGLPFFAVSTTAPLLQRWFSYTDHALARDPYFLYAASNVGSLLALLSYPLIVEPLLPMREQTLAWSAGYSLLVCLMVACGIVTWRKCPPGAKLPAGQLTLERSSSPAPSVSRRLTWLARSFVPSSLMLAVTAYLSTDISPIPLLWILPLSLYLLTFIMAFGSDTGRLIRIARRSVPLVVLPLVMLMVAHVSGSLWYIVPLHLAVFFAIALGCHAWLAADRPTPKYLTSFYLWMAAGGMMAGVFNSLIAPRLFTEITEYPLVVTLGCFMLASRSELLEVIYSAKLLIRPAAASALVAAALLVNRRFAAHMPLLPSLAPAMLVCFSVSRQAARLAFGVALLLMTGILLRDDGRLLHAERTFFGVYRVMVDPDGRFHSLFHGTTLHGKQALDGKSRMQPLTYYHPDGPIGQVFALRDQQAHLRIAVVGLGTGSLAGYLRPGEVWRFYEIDPAVERIAREPKFFSYLEACSTACEIELGDARLSLAREQGLRFDIIVLDAFSSDAIPVHLLTREALSIYLARLAPTGLLAFHISNRHLSLRPVLAALARHYGLIALDRMHVVSPSALAAGAQSSEWLVIARRPEDVSELAADSRWVPVAAEGTTVWSDDFSNILSVLRWR